MLNVLSFKLINTQNGFVLFRTYTSVTL